MNYEEFRAWLGAVERDLPVRDWTAAGFHVWPLLRLSLYAANFAGTIPQFSLGGGARQHGRVVASALSSWARAFIGDRRRNEPPDRKADTVFLAYSVGRQPMLDGRFLNPLVAPYVKLLEDQGKSSLVWEMSPFGDYNIPRAKPSYFIQPVLIWERLASQQLRSLPEIHLDGFDDLVNRSRVAGLTFPQGNPTRLARDVSYIRHLADRFKRWMERVEPTHGFVADYSLRDQAFCLACTELGITSVEIQHGLQAGHHSAYGDWFAVPPGGFETRPDVFWCWTESGANMINQWAQRPPAAHVAVFGGDPWSDMWTDASSAPAIALEREVASIRSTAPDAHHILLCLRSVGEIMPPILRDALRAAPANWRFFIRLHPVNQATRRLEALAALRELGLPADSIDVATRLPLPGLLEHVDCAVIVGLSTVIQQAVAAGVPAVACGEDSAQAASFLSGHLDVGLFRLPKSAQEMLSDLTAACERPRSERPRVAGSAEEAMRRVLSIDKRSSPASAGVA